jgi:hypothetical protein
MTNGTRERLECLTEELSEAAQMACKALRHGLDSTHRDYGNVENAELLAEELGHVQAWIDVLLSMNEIPQGELWEARKSKLAKIRRGTHFHHQHDLSDAALAKAGA